MKLIYIVLGILLFLIIVFGVSKTYYDLEKSCYIKPAQIKNIGIVEELDTQKLCNFWIDFQSDVVEKNEEEIIRKMNFPFIGMHIAAIEFAKSCDTSLYAMRDDMYGTLIIDKNNLNEYIDLLFNENLIEMISSISCDSIIHFGQNTGYSIVYNHELDQKKFPCSDKFILVLNLFYTNEDTYSVSLGTCC